MSSESLTGEREPMMINNEETATPVDDDTLTRRAKKKHHLAPIDTSSKNSDLRPAVDTPLSFPSLPSTPCTPVSAIQAQHMTEIVYEQIVDKKKKYKIWAIVLFCLCSILFIIGLTGVVMGSDSSMNPWAIGLGTFLLLLGTVALVGGLALCLKVSRLGEEATQLASSEVIERSSTHTYTHFAVMPSPMVLRRLVGSVGKRDNGQSSGKNVTKQNVDDVSTRTHQVSVSDKGYTQDDSTHVNREQHNHTQTAVSPISTSSVIVGYQNGNSRNSRTSLESAPQRNTSLQPLDGSEVRPLSSTDPETFGNSSLSNGAAVASI
ncbi:uncharacterized protein LOC144435018 [Glandiceps talaboti]